MIKHLVKIIWNQRRRNGWMAAEILLVFVVLWYIIDSLMAVGKVFFAPMGWDIDHVYWISMGVEEVDRNEMDSTYRYVTSGRSMLTAIDRIKTCPGVEAVGAGLMSMPHTGENRYMQVDVNDSINVEYVKLLEVTSGFLEVKIAVRVNPSADHDFPEFFVKQMEKQLSIDRLYLLDVIPYSDLRYSMELRNGVKSELQNQIAVMGFLLFNIFLGIIGTFWFRTEQRKGEMGLRIALGSTRFSLKGIMIAEGVLLLTLIAVPPLLICFNLHVSELTKGFYMDYTIARFAAGFLITYLVMAVMIILGIWYPAHQMARLEPADALRYE